MLEFKVRPEIKHDFCMRVKGNSSRAAAVVTQLPDQKASTWPGHQ
jgi:hypothetical protein